jgi:hypothetical protein
MKKITLLTIAVAFFAGLTAQNVLFNNWPLVTHANQGAGGQHASALDTNLHSTYGFRCANTSTGVTFRVAEEFTVTGTGWVCDSIIFYSYQTGSSTTSTITMMDFMIWSGAPDGPTSTIVYGDSLQNRLDATSFSGIYRSRTVDLQNNQRPIMRVAHKFVPALTLVPGTYYVDWRTAGSMTSGPWVPPVTIAQVVSTGDGLQKNGGTWANVNDQKSNQPQGLPFIIKGTGVGINEVGGVASVDIYPNPMVNNATVAINFSQAGMNISDISFVVFDMVGKEVIRMENLSSQRFTIERGNLSAGMYLFQVVNANGVLKTGKITVE